MLEIFVIFFRLGAIGFGGPIALVALIQQEICNTRKWVTHAEFAEIFSICKLLPGPIAVQVAIYIGYKRAGRLGGIISGIAFNLPALLLIIGLSILYTYNNIATNPKTLYLFKFMQAATLAVIILATWDLGKNYINSLRTITTMTLGAVIIFIYPTWEPLAIIVVGLLGVIKLKDTRFQNFAIATSMPNLATIAPAAVLQGKLAKLLVICLKAGWLSFGTGLAIIPLLQGDLVSHTHWLTDKQFIDGVALGQITPGPTTISIVFFGYQIAGIYGLIIATLGFYIPAFINILIIIPLVWKKLTTTPYLQTFISWSFPVIIGGIISATIKIGYTSMTHYYDIILCIIALIIISKKILPIWAVIPIYGAIGLAIGILI
jgi:chromate transporter